MRLAQDVFGCPDRMESFRFIHMPIPEAPDKMTSHQKFTIVSGRSCHIVMDESTTFAYRELLLGFIEQQASTLNAFLAMLSLHCPETAIHGHLQYFLPSNGWHLAGLDPASSNITRCHCFPVQTLDRILRHPNTDQRRRCHVSAQDICIRHPWPTAVRSRERGRG